MVQIEITATELDSVTLSLEDGTYVTVSYDSVAGCMRVKSDNPWLMPEEDHFHFPFPASEGLG